MVGNLYLPTQYVLNSPVTALRLDEQVFSIIKWARARESRVVCVANVHMIMEAYWNPEFASILGNADLVAPDGMPLVWMLRQMGAEYQDRAAGMDLFLHLCRLASACNIKVFFLGSHQTMLQQIEEKLKQDFPSLHTVGMEPLPFRPLTPEEDEAVVAKINQSGAGIVFVSLGCPKQERWMAEHQGKVQAVMLGVGAVFPTYAGVFQRAPRYVRESGLEWFYRLAQEPRRLWKRYRQTIPPFMWLAVKQLLNQSDTSLFTSPVDAANNPFLAEMMMEFAFNSQPAKLGEILLRQNLISPEILQSVLDEQRINRHRLGEILLRRNLISQLELNYYLTNQHIKLGEVLILNKVITPPQLQKTLEEQKLSNQKLGSLIARKKRLASDKLTRFLEEQYLRQQGLWMLADPPKKAEDLSTINV